MLPNRAVSSIQSRSAVRVHFTVFRASSYSALSVLNRPSPFTHSERTLLRLAGVALATCGKSPKSS